MFGGFAGRFLKDAYLFQINSKQFTRTAVTPNETFLFQMPIAVDSRTGTIFSCDMQQQLSYSYDLNNQWKTHMTLRQ